MQTSDHDFNLADRVASLEKQNRSMRRLLVAAIVGAGALVTMGAVKPDRQKTVTAERFVLVDENGLEMATLGPEKSAREQVLPMLRFYRWGGEIHLGDRLQLKNSGEEAGLFIQGSRHKGIELFMNDRSARIENTHFVIEDIAGVERELQIAEDGKVTFEKGEE